MQGGILVEWTLINGTIPMNNSHPNILWIKFDQSFFSLQRNINLAVVLLSTMTNKLMSQDFQLSRLQTAFHKFYGNYNDLVCRYNLPLRYMLSDIFHTNR
jgi:hypothetical protein